jgi:protein-tyrosine-phosphatase
MQEEGVDLRERVPRLLNDDLARWADVVVTMGCGDACPVIPGRRYIDWDLADPKDMPIADVRRIRDDIKTRVASLVEELENQTG